MLSNEGIPTRFINFRQAEDELGVRSKIPGRALIVITITKMEELHTFESKIKHLRIRYAIWLIIFTRDARQDVCEFCRNPHGILSNPRFGSKVLISCCDSNMIEEWRYNPENRTRKLEVGRVMKDNLKIVWISDELHNRRRYSLNGQTLRIAADRVIISQLPPEKGIASSSKTS